MHPLSHRKVLGAADQKISFLCIFRYWIQICSWNWKKKHGFFNIFFNAKIAEKIMFFEVTKKPEGDGEILTLDSDSATQNPSDVTTLVRRTTYIFCGAVLFK